MYVAVDAAGVITELVPVVASRVPAGLTDTDRGSLVMLEVLEGRDPGLVKGLMGSAFGVLGRFGFRPKPFICPAPNLPDCGPK